MPKIMVCIYYIFHCHYEHFYYFVFIFTDLYRLAEPNATLTFVYHDCGKSTALNNVNREYSPYLFPFIIENCILGVGIWFNIYLNINQCPHKKLLFHHQEEKNDGKTGEFRQTICLM